MCVRACVCVCVCVCDHARLNTTLAQHAGAWLRATPNNNLGLAMPQKEFILSLRHWLGVPLFSSASKLCSCGHHLDRFGDHLLGCGQGNWRTDHHDALCDVIFNALLVDNVNCRKAAHILKLSQDSVFPTKAKPADV